MWISLLGFVALTMNSGPMQVFGQQYLARGSTSLDEADAARYSLDGALCTRRLESGCVVLVFSEQLRKERHTRMYPTTMLFRLSNKP
jgi:hypothetical protein